VVGRHVVRFVSRNKQKAESVQAILKQHQVEMVPVMLHIEELNSQDIERIARDKVLKAFQHSGRPLFVEQTGMTLPLLNNFFVGSIHKLWEVTGPDRLARMFGNSSDPRVVFTSVVAYVDGRRVHLFRGKVEGTVAKRPRGTSDLPWENVFIPNGETRTVAELNPRGFGVLLRTGALEKFARHLHDPRTADARGHDDGAGAEVEAEPFARQTAGAGEARR
jgi:XTP/dITP diphosphohydrolase